MWLPPLILTQENKRDRNLWGCVCAGIEEGPSVCRSLWVCLSMCVCVSVFFVGLCVFECVYECLSLFVCV